MKDAPQWYIWNIRLTRWCRRRHFCIVLKDDCKLTRYQIYVASVANFVAFWPKLTFGKNRDIMLYIERLCVWKTEVCLGVDPSMMCTVHKFLPMSKWASECFFLSDITYTTQMSCPANLELTAFNFHLLPFEIVIGLTLSQFSSLCT